MRSEEDGSEIPHKTALTIFGESYEYTRGYRAFKENMKQEKLKSRKEGCE